jgi:hypothetical protein
MDHVDDPDEISLFCRVDLVGNEKSKKESVLTIRSHRFFRRVD